MLQMFAVENFKNFKNRIQFDLGSINNYEFNVDAVYNKTVKNALIYGENGSGKSNLVYAVMDITGHLTDHNRKNEFYQHYINLESDKDYATFEYTFKFKDDICKYTYQKYDFETMKEENLYINDEKVLEYSFENPEKRYLNIVGTEHLRKETGSNKLSFLKYVLNNSLLIFDKNHEILNNLERFVSNMLTFNCLDGNIYQGFRSGSSSLAEYIIKNGKVDEFSEFLKQAGLPFNLVEKNIDGEQLLFAKFKDKEVNFFNVASKGTRALTLFYYWLIDFEKISFLMIDEFDAFYHNKLARFIVGIARGKNVQCIMTTHNTSIMDNDLLRPDCYFTLEKNQINSFANLTSKELRKAHNIEKMYRAGAFDNDK